MNEFETHISQQVSDYLNDNLKNIASFEAANQKMYADFGIIHFFDNDTDFDQLKANISTSNSILSESNRVEYGDFQTNENLANQVTLQLVAKNISPEIVVEPTCGKGNFIVAALRNFLILSD